MKTLKDYITEKLVINKDTKVSNRQHFRPKDEHDAWTEECLNALKERFGNRYNIMQTWSGTICFYQKGKRAVIKNLVCVIAGIEHDKLAADFGPNDRLEKTLGQEILDVIKDM